MTDLSVFIITYDIFKKNNRKTISNIFDGHQNNLHVISNLYLILFYSLPYIKIIIVTVSIKFLKAKSLLFLDEHQLTL
jgi:hypothetical protein